MSSSKSRFPSHDHEKDKYRIFALTQDGARTIAARDENRIIQLMLQNSNMVRLVEKARAAPFSKSKCHVP